MNILLIIIYKQLIENSTTITSFCNQCIKYHKKTKVIIWDNSPNNINIDSSYLKQYNINYKLHHTPENLSLSVIYNKVVDKYSNSNFLHIFDQDSILTEEYFDSIYDADKQNNDIGLFIPYVKHGNLIVSPGNFKLYKGEYWKTLKTGRVSSRNKLCIASGMTIRPSCITIKNIRFDENLSLYGIDSQFCIDYSKHFDYLFVINYKLEHSLSMFEKESIDLKIKRYKSYMSSLKYITKKKSFIAYMIASTITNIRYLRLLIINWHKHL